MVHVDVTEMRADELVEVVLDLERSLRLDSSLHGVASGNQRQLVNVADSDSKGGLKCLVVGLLEQEPGFKESTREGLGVEETDVLAIHATEAGLEGKVDEFSPLFDCGGVLACRAGNNESIRLSRTTPSGGMMRWGTHASSVSPGFSAHRVGSEVGNAVR